MKKLFKTATILILLIITLFSVTSCNSANIETDKYNITLPAGFKKSNFFSEEDLQIYNKGWFSDDMITISYYRYSDVKALCYTYYGTKYPTQEQMEKSLCRVYTDSLDFTSNGTITLDKYTLYEYSDLFESTAATYIFFGQKYAWTIEFSIENKKYESFKGQIPAVLDSFVEK